MNENQIRKKLKTLCIDVLGSMDVDMDIIEGVNFIDDMGMDSIGFITLIVEIETQFGITVPTDKLLMENFATIDDVLKIVTVELEVSEVIENDKA